MRTHPAVLRSWFMARLFSRRLFRVRDACRRSPMRRVDERGARRPAAHSTALAPLPRRVATSFAVELERVQALLGRLKTTFGQSLRIEQEFGAGVPCDHFAGLVEEPHLFSHRDGPGMVKAGFHGFLLQTLRAAARSGRQLYRAGWQPGDPGLRCWGEGDRRAQGCAAGRRVVVPVSACNADRRHPPATKAAAGLHEVPRGAAVRRAKHMARILLALSHSCAGSPRCRTGV